MALNRAKEDILKKVRQALIRKAPTQSEPNFVSDIFARPEEEDLLVMFAQNLVRTKAAFFYCENQQDFTQQLQAYSHSKGFKHMHVWEPSLQNILREIPLAVINNELSWGQAQVGITSCDSLIARTGSVLYTSQTASGRRLSIYPPHHIVVAYTHQVVYDIEDAFRNLRIKYHKNFPSMVCLETGPSRTADIEKTLVLGAHGPKELTVFLIDDAPDSGSAE
ncbi:MAG TPA: LUD domain-containing protein [Cytophagaceae bacterium]|jgi:L-lactate dehydrogenase complex protein LldG|nr:LUD domain-containing protein [Cytophagaceae bacterium]